MKSFFNKKPKASPDHPVPTPVIDAPAQEESIGVRITKHHGFADISNFKRPDYSHLPDATLPEIIKYFQHVDAMLSSKYEGIGYSHHARPLSFNTSILVDNEEIARTYGTSHMALCISDHPNHDDYRSFFKEMFKRDIYNLVLENDSWSVSMYAPIVLDDNGEVAFDNTAIQEALVGYDSADLTDANCIDGNDWLESIAPSADVEAMNSELFTYLTTSTVRLVNAAKLKKELIATIDIGSWVTKDLSFDHNVGDHDQYAFGKEPYSLFTYGYRKYQNWLEEHKLYHILDTETDTIRVSPVLF